MRNGALQTPMNDLRKDLQAVARDAEALLRATADVTGEKVQSARTKTEETVRQAFDTLYGPGFQRRAKSFARATDTYVRDHSWSIIGIAAGAALLIGFLSTRRR
jgi:ElaB/YqjD/DUF883 family membrane-anchored ribosome-binding protein